MTYVKYQPRFEVVPDAERRPRKYDAMLNALAAGQTVRLWIAAAGGTNAVRATWGRAYPGVKLHFRQDDDDATCWIVWADVP